MISAVPRNGDTADFFELTPPQEGRGLQTDDKQTSLYDGLFSTHGVVSVASLYPLVEWRMEGGDWGGWYIT